MWYQFSYHLLIVVIVSYQIDVVNPRRSNRPRVSNAVAVVHGQSTDDRELVLWLSFPVSVQG